MKISKEQLQEIIASHGKWLRGEEGGERADLHSADLSGADMHSAYLYGACLSEADLSGADLRGANLCSTNLRGANLRGADLREVNLCGASMYGADMFRANLRSANLHETDLREANLHSADLSGADPCAVNLHGADLRETVIDKRYYEVVRIGSRQGATTYCVDDDNVLCGCWNSYKGGTLAEFKQRVENVYGENGKTPNAKYYGQYMAAIDFFERMKKLQEERKNEN